MSAPPPNFASGSRFLDHIWKKIETYLQHSSGPTYTLATGLISKMYLRPYIRAPVTARNIVCIKINHWGYVMSQKTLFTKSALAVAVALIPPRPGRQAFS